MMNRESALAQARALVQQMTLEEKASQLRYNAPAIPRLGVPAYNWWNEALHGVARAGTATVFPQAIGLAAMFDDERLEKIADIIATEGRAKYNMQSAHEDRDIYKGLTFWSPNINIFRDPRWGRGHETYGEDPFLTSRLGVAFVRGLQGNGQYMKSAACAKHFAVHSGPESLRHEFDAVADKKDMEETYLPAFEALVKEAKVESVMGAYNRVNGEPACGSKTLLQDTLREKWGFEGHVVSDCWAIADFHMHHMVTATAPESAALAISNGCDLNCGHTYLYILQAYHEGLVTEEQITTAAERLMTTRYMLGLFDEKCEWNAIPYTENDTDESANAALEAAEKSIVLLKNDGLLPLDVNKIGTIAVIGPNADSTVALRGNYFGTSSRNVTLLSGIRKACEGEARVLYSEGCHLYKDRTSGLAQAEDRLAEAVACAELADVVVLCVGLDETIEGEQGDTGNEFSSGDKETLELPLSQRKLVEAIVATGKPLVTVVMAGSALRVEAGNALLMAWYPGQAGGEALANILFGKVSPSGKLPVTFYYGLEDLPEFTDYAMTNQTYRYYRGVPLYPFGYGLTYGDTALSGASIDINDAGGNVRVTVTNRSDRAIDEVVQVYLQSESRWAPPNPQLAAFQRLALAPQEQREVTLSISARALTVVNEDGERIRDGNRFTAYVGTSQPDERSVELTGSAPLRIEFQLDAK